MRLPGRLLSLSDHLRIFGRDLINISICDQFPFSSIIALLHKRCTCSREWDTKRTVTPESNILMIFFSLFLRNLASPRKDLVQDQDLRFYYCGNGKAKSGFHTGGIIFHRNIHEFLKFREFYNLIIFAVINFLVYPSMAPYR